MYTTHKTEFTELKASQTHSTTLPHIVMWLTENIRNYMQLGNMQGALYVIGLQMEWCHFH